MFFKKSLGGMKTPGDEKMIALIIKSRIAFFIWGFFSLFILYMSYSEIVTVGLQISLFIVFLSSLLSIYIFIYSYIVFRSFKKRVWETIRINMCFREGSRSPFFVDILRVLGLDYFSDQNSFDKKTARTILNSRLSILNLYNLKRLANLLLKYEADILESYYAKETEAQKEFNYFFDREEKNKKTIVRDNSMSQEKIAEILEKYYRTKKDSKKAKKSWKNVCGIIKMMGLEVWPSHKIYLKLDPNSL